MVLNQNLVLGPLRTLAEALELLGDLLHYSFYLPLSEVLVALHVRQLLQGSAWGGKQEVALLQSVSLTLVCPHPVSCLVLVVSIVLLFLLFLSMELLRQILVLEQVFRLLRSSSDSEVRLLIESAFFFDFVHNSVGENRKLFFLDFYWLSLRKRAWEYLRICLLWTGSWILPLLSQVERSLRPWRFCVEDFPKSLVSSRSKRSSWLGRNYACIDSRRNRISFVVGLRVYIHILKLLHRVSSCLGFPQVLSRAQNVVVNLCSNLAARLSHLFFLKFLSRLESSALLSLLRVASLYFS